MVVALESAVLWGGLGLSAALGIGAQIQLWHSRRSTTALQAALAVELKTLRDRAERDRNTIDSEVASYLNLSREELADLRGRLDKFKESVETDLDDMSADLDVIENSVASCVRASRASPFSSLNLQFLNDGLDDVRARLAALELAAQKAKLEQQAATEEARPLWLVQREAPVRPAARRAGAAERAGDGSLPAAEPEPPKQAVQQLEPPEPASRPARASLADWLSPSDLPVNDDTPAIDEAEALPWPGSLSRLASF